MLVVINSEQLFFATVVVGKEIPHHISDRRPGDHGVLVADSSKAREELGWAPGYGGEKEIISTAWEWVN